VTTLKQCLPVSLKHRVKAGLQQIPGVPELVTGYEWYRGATSAFRLRPSFLVIGAQRAGTSSFYWNLVRHPALLPAWTKEIHFFDVDDNYRRGPSWYWAQFPMTLGGGDLLDGVEVMTGEATPAYLYHPRVPRRVAELLPDVKLIVLLRDPVARAYSNYQMSVRHGRESSTFAQAIRRELAHLGGRAITRTSLEDCAAIPYLQRGVYVEQLKNWLAYFDREQLQVLDSRQFHAHPLATLSTTATEFLGLPRWSHGEYHEHHEEGVKDPPMDPEVREQLKEFFRPYNEELYDLLHWMPLWS
jgi:sulfotransferase family protein